MKMSTIKVIKKSSYFKLPINARQILFIDSVKFRPNKEMEISIEKCSVGHSFYIGEVQIIHIHGLEFLLYNLPEEHIVYSKEIGSLKESMQAFYNCIRKQYTVFNKKSWLTNFPEKYDNARSIDAGKDLFLLQNTDYRSLIPPKFENLFCNLLKYCEEYEFYELCNDLMKFAKDWFIFYENDYLECPLFENLHGYAWLYDLNKRYKFVQELGNPQISEMRVH